MPQESDTMPARRSAGQPESGAFDPSFQDSEDLARTSFDFSEMPNHESGMIPFGGDFHDDDMHSDMLQDMYDDDDMMQKFFDGPDGPFPAGSNWFNSSQNRANINSASDWRSTSDVPRGNSPSRQPVPHFPHPQRGIVNSRGGQVTENFGQIIHPEEDAQKSTAAPSTVQPQRRQSRGEDAGKLSNEQRARNAANHRHHKSRKSRSDGSQQGGDDEDDEEGQKEGKGLAFQREKNRIAAAKCRAKKKAGNELRQNEAREKAGANEFLTRHVRDLRDERSRLRSLILAHNPDVCGCSDIHQFNLNEAQKLVFGSGCHGMHSKSSPSQTSSSSTQSPISDMLVSGSPFSATQAVPSGRMSMSFRKQSVSEGSFDQGMVAEKMQSAQAAGVDGQQGSQDFAEFLHSSPGGRAAFS